ncbi:LysR substrate-binding domain-containing protein [Vitiosangium sp. GDMCC 1.1324]|uniref:LysR substrate-binding domain-containing protein n=1 Tax=Vitiosangium sp. (strain GDMCC 1.1324) TaxID=2138576 RepID=UPI000D379DC9|nr:LysR substrate-binding domain-containing protein [Vitiosangium sp. GDMCC 1.1324]PTL75199.1 LysR family transcriptional regulator [Vitiosangium sp. GDMCC 1.1324]
MELRHLHYFIAVAEELHFGRAAARLGMAQPPLSQQIRRLEEELGVLLFERSQRHVKLTEAGEAFLREARLVLSQTEQAALAAQRASRGQQGFLTVGFVASVALHFFPALLRAFRRRYPDVELSLQELRSQDQVVALHQEKLKVGLLRPTKVQDAAGLHLEHLLEEDLMAVLPEGHPLAARSQVDMAVLVRESVILPPRESGCGILYDLVHQVCQREGFTPRITQHATELQARIGLVAGGLGVALVPVSMLKFRCDGVVYRHLQEPTPKLELAVASRAGERSPLVRAFIEVAREVAAAELASREGRVVSISQKS